MSSKETRHEFAFTYTVPLYNNELILEAEIPEKRESFQKSLEELVTKDTEYKIEFYKHRWVVTFYLEDNDYALFVSTKKTFFYYNLLKIEKSIPIYLFY